MAAQDRCNRLQARAAIHRPRRIVRGVQEEPARPIGDRLGEGRRGELEARRRVRLQEPGPAAEEADDVGVGRPAGRRDDDLVAGVQGRSQRVVDYLLGARGDMNLLGPEAQAVLPLELEGHGRLDLAPPVGCRVVREALPSRQAGGLDHVLGGREVRLAPTQGDHVAALGTQGRRAPRHAEGRRHRQGAEPPASELRAHYPPASRGLHRVRVTGRPVSLTTSFRRLQGLGPGGAAPGEGPDRR